MKTSPPADHELSSQLGDIQSCDREPIQFLGAVQGHGCILFFSAQDERVLNASQSAESFFHIPLSEILGARLEQICEKALYQEVREAVQSYPWRGQTGKHLSYKAQRPNLGFDSYLFRSEDLFGLELERFNFSSEKVAVENSVLREFMVEAKALDRIEDLALLLCQSVRQLTGMNRVMIYRFLAPAMHGEVIAEDKVVQAHSFLNHRFPASDIPSQARNLYIRNQVRLIPDIEMDNSRIEPARNQISGKPLDLTDSRLRAVSPIHLEYLRNMGVRASFSVSITVDGQLWGLIACHHLSAHFVSQNVRTLCELLAHAFSIQAVGIERGVDRELRLQFDRRLREFLTSLQTVIDPINELFKMHKALGQMFGVNGLALVSRDKVDMAGLTPPKSILSDLAAKLKSKIQTESGRFAALRKLSDLDPSFASLTHLVCGVLAVPIPEVHDSILLLFRPEFIKTVTWGGDPRKQLEQRNFAGRVNPRLSFGSWTEEIRGQSHDWQDYEIEGAQFLRDFVFNTLVRKDLLIRELTARGK